MEQNFEKMTELCESRLNEIRLRFLIFKLIFRLQKELDKSYIEFDRIFLELYDLKSRDVIKFVMFLEDFIDEMTKFCGIESCHIDTIHFRLCKKQYCPKYHYLTNAAYAINGDCPNSDFHISYRKQYMMENSVDALIKDFVSRINLLKTTNFS